MRKWIVISVLFLLQSLAGFQLRAQQVWAEVNLSSEEVMVGEPVELRITVYTPTFFTRGPDPGNIKVEGGFSVYFRPLSKSFRRDGKTYAGVELRYKLFPYQAGTLEIPALEIACASPDEGDYRGKDRRVTTEKKTVSVTPVPSGLGTEEVLVSSSLTVNDPDAGKTLEFKVGEVMERTISREASGTVSEMIPPISWDSISGVRIYPSRPEIETKKTRTDITSTRVERVKYLFEKEGDVELPEMEFSWYHPVQKQVYKRTIPAIRVRVVANENLGVLQSRKDSLSVDANTAEVGEADISDAGMPWQQMVLMILLTAGGVVGLYVLGRRVLAWRRLRHREYLQSEAWYFKQFLKANRKGDFRQSVNALYLWLNKAGLRPANLEEVEKRTGMVALRQEKAVVEGGLQPGNRSGKFDAGLWKKVRKQLKAEVEASGMPANWINPGRKW